MRMNSDMISKRLKIIRDLQEELNKIKEHYDEALESNAQFQQMKEELSKVREESKTKEEKILSNSSYKGMHDQLKEKRQELKDHKEVLAMEMLDYYKENGTLEVEDDQGNVKKIKFSVKLTN
ncbi:MAG TPA: hypothetical protein VLI92_03225 [Candidatus Saccharimonadales bacterium]|nr:hypothetical protein [Candidatus Saccharimonadales bacterium]